MNHCNVTLERVDPICKAVLELARENGPDAVTSRGVAERAGVVPSYINYKYGGLPRLMHEAYAQADQARAEFWRQALTQLSSDVIDPNDLGPIIFTQARSALVAYGGAEDLFWCSNIAAARGVETDLQVGSVKHEHVYWSAVASKVTQLEVHSDILLAFCLALRFSYLAFDAPEEFDPWALALIGQFVSRLKGEAPAYAVDSIFRQQADSAALFNTDIEPPDHETARKIVHTAADLILEEGVAAVSHRKIAAKGDVSVSSVQHFFRNRAAYIRAAFQEIYRRIIVRTIPQLPPENSVSADDLIAYLSHRAISTRQDSLREFAAMNSLTLAAAYHRDSGDIARALVARVGATSSTILHSLSERRGEIGRLDGQLFSMIVNQTQTLQVCADRAELGCDLDFSIFGSRLIKALFI